MSRICHATVLLIASFAVAGRTHAQEFVKQLLLIAPLRADSASGAASGALAKFARQIADVARSRVDRALNEKDVEVLPQFRLEKIFVESGYDRDAVLSEGEIRIVARQMRVDEVVHGRVAQKNGAFLVAARLALSRNWGMQQPLPLVRAATATLAGTDEVLALDTANTYAAVIRAEALESEHRPSEAAAQWSRVYIMQPDSLLLGVSIVEALLRLQKPAAALTDARELAALAHWKEAAALGDSLERDDAAFRADSNYTTRHIEALRQSGDTLAALECSVRGVRRYPTDSRIYLQYLQLLGVESAVALPRGLAKFPDVPELFVLAASTARKTGNRTAAIRAGLEAIKRDSSLTQQYLQISELLLEDNRPDSALKILARAPRTSEQSELLRGYAIGRGVTLLTASKSRVCGDSRSADATLIISASAIDRGLGESANVAEIKTAFDAMRVAVDNATKVLCKG
jgi:tetratricopeptide (TPR) repeat protein